MMPRNYGIEHCKNNRNSALWSLSYDSKIVRITETQLYDLLFMILKL